ncbi:MAG: serine hydrolase domain-containing protein [Bacteroidota bacterium]
MKIILNLGSFITLSVALSLSAYGQNLKRLSQQTDSLVKSELAGVAPGGVVLIAKKGKVIYRKAFGVANLQTKITMQPDMIFRIGSMSKQFTAIAVLQLVERGKINLQDSIQAYVPDFPHKPYPITIENILTQSSGIINFMEMKNTDPKKEHEHYTAAQGVDYFKDEPLQFKPGSKFQYSNSNYYLLGYLVEQVTGQSFGDYLQQHIIGPAALEHTTYIPANPKIDNMASGYSRFDSQHWEDAELQEPTMLYSTGGLASNVDDLLKWHQALDSGKLISKAMLTKAYTAFKPTDGDMPQYGYGWFIKEIDGLETIEHSGSTDGYQTDEVWLPDADVLIITLFNGFETDMDWQVITNDIARFAIGHSLRPVLKLREDNLEKLTGTYAVGEDHKLIISLKKHKLYVQATNPKDRLPKVELLADGVNHFYIKEAPLKFEFKADASKQTYTLTTYNSSGKDADWKKIK